MAVIDFEDMVSGEEFDLEPELMGKGRLRKRIRSRFKKFKSGISERKRLRHKIRSLRKKYKGMPRKKRRKMLRPLRKQLRQKRRTMRRGLFKGLARMALAPTGIGRKLAIARAIKKRRALKKKGSGSHRGLVRRYLL